MTQTLTISVPANQRLTHTGIQLKPGMTIQVAASGFIEAAGEKDARTEYHKVPPEGRKGLKGSFPVPRAPGLGLFAMLENGRTVFVGKGGQMTLRERMGWRTALRDQR